jgi:hypothetical protein
MSGRCSRKQQWSIATIALRAFTDEASCEGVDHRSPRITTATVDYVKRLRVCTLKALFIAILVAPALANNRQNVIPKGFRRSVIADHAALLGYHWEASSTLGPDQSRPLRMRVQSYTAAA